MDLGGERGRRPRHGVGCLQQLLDGSGHIFAGKLEVPAPSEFSQWLDVSGLTANSQAEITVGEHAYQLDGNRWGYKFAYLRGSLDAEVAYVTSGADLNGFNAYDWGQDKTLQYKLAFANRSNPLEFGYYGARGSWPLSEGDSISTTATDFTRSATRSTACPDSLQPIR